MLPLREPFISKKGNTMSLIDTHKYGQLYVDASMTITNLEDSGRLSEERRDMLRTFEESGADFTFDPDWSSTVYGYEYMGDPEQLPLILVGSFGGYPGEAIDRANADAAREWAAERDYILVTVTRFGGCDTVSLWFDLSSSAATSDGAQEAVELAEWFREYPVLDEDLWSRYQSEEWERMIVEMITDAENDREESFTDDQREQIIELADEFRGYWDEGYFDSGEWETIVGKVLSGDVQLHQDDALPIDFTKSN